MAQTTILGIGPGQSGEQALAAILNQQPQAAVSFQEPPLLPWRSIPGQPGIRQRLDRLRSGQPGQIVGDVAHFYLPYLEEAIAHDPAIRIICLKRPRAEVVASMCATLDSSSPLGIDHWSVRPEAGFGHDPYWTRLFPQYDNSSAAGTLAGMGQAQPGLNKTSAGVGAGVVTNLGDLSSVAGFAEAGRTASATPSSAQPGISATPLSSTTGLRQRNLGRYWDEYYQTVEELTRRFPQNIRLFDWRQALGTETGMREMLGFVGIPADQQVIKPAKLDEQPDKPKRPPAQWRRSLHPMDPRKCVILVPYTDHIVQACDRGLKELERRGYQVRRVVGFAAIDQGRNQIATDALLDGFEETLWIDSDVGFEPDAVQRLRSHNLPVVAGIYPKKGKRAIACHVMPGSDKMGFGDDGGLHEILYAGAGFLLIRRQVYLDVQTQLKLPMCNERFGGNPMIPFFHPMLMPHDDGHWYLAEDYAFCQRARQCGYKVMADTSIRLWHFGHYGYSWEDAGVDRPRSEGFTLNFGAKPK